MTDIVMEPELTEDCLVKQAQEGDHEAFTLLYERYLTYVRQRIYSILKTQIDLDDVVQEVFIAVYLDLPSFRGDSLFSTWLTSILRAKAHRHLRYMIPRKSDSSETLRYFCSSSNNQELDLSHQQEKLLLTKLIDDLPDHLSDVAKLRLKDYTLAQIAEKLNVTENAVKLRHQRLQSLLTEKWRDYQTQYERGDTNASQERK